MSIHSENFNFSAIGVVKSSYQQKFGTPRQPGLVKDSRAFIELKPKCQPELSLDGLKDFSHLWVIFVFHRNDNARFHAKVHPPRLRGDTVGVFASRSPHRPNPIGLSVVEIERVVSNGIWVRGVDLLDGTPVLDIKPYLPEIESKPAALGGWAGELSSARAMQVEWSTEAQLALALEVNKQKPNLRTMIEQTIALDPRPLVYQSDNGSESHYRDSHVMQIENVDVSFYFKSYGHAIVLNLKPVEPTSAAR